MIVLKQLAVEGQALDLTATLAARLISLALRLLMKIHHRKADLYGNNRQQCVLFSSRLRGGRLAYSSPQ